MQGRFANVAGLRRHRPADLEGLLAARVGGLQPVGQRQDGDSRRLQQVRDRADDRLRAALQPDGADHAAAAVDRRQRRRHRPGRARLRRLSVGRLRDQLRRPAVELRRALAGAVRSGPEAALPAGVQRRHHARSADGRDAVVRVLSAATSSNITVRQNTLRTAASYDQFSIASPLDGSAIPVWLPKPGVASQVANVDSTSDDMKRAYNGFDIDVQRPHAAAASAPSAASASSARSTTCACRRRAIRTAALYCDQSESGIPWQKQFKATVVYPLPWYGHLGQRGAAEPERLPVGHGGAGLRRLHGRHRLRQSERPRHVLPGDADDPLRGRTARARARRARWCCRRWRPAAWQRSACRSWLRKRSSRRASTSSTSRSASRSSSARSA